MSVKPDYGFEPRLPAIPSPNDSNLTEVVAAIRESLQVRTGAVGDGMDRAVTLRDLLNSGMAMQFDLRNIGNGGATPLPLGTGGNDPDTPPTPEHLEATGAFKYIMLTWQFARGYSRLAYFEVWRAAVDNIGDAVVIGQTSAPIYADNVGPGNSFYYWVRAVSDAAPSPFNALSGTLGQTEMDPEYLLEILTGKITMSQLYTDLAEQINLIDGAASLAGSVNARVAAARAALQLEIDDAGSAIVALQEADEQYAQSLFLMGTRVGNAESSITDINVTTGQHAQSLNSLNTRVGSAENSITTLNTTTGNQANSITQLTSTVGDHTATIESNTTAVDGLELQLTVKVDNNGHVSGWGFASNWYGAAPYSAFIYRVDSFVIGAPGLSNVVPFVVYTTATTINGVAVAPGVYMANAVIANGSIGNAKIGNLAVDDAKIANLKVSKLLAGKLGVGEYIESTNYAAGSTGFRVHGNGNAEFSNVTIRGTVYATAGQIGGNVIDTTGVQSPGYTANSAGWRLNSDGNAYFNSVSLRGAIMGGNFTGYGWPAAGGNGFYLGGQGLLMGGAGGKYFHVEANGDIRAPGFTIINGAPYFNGDVQAKTFSTIGGRFTAGADGVVVADMVDIRRRLVLETGVHDPIDMVEGSYVYSAADGGPQSAYYQPGHTFVVPLETMIITNIYDADTVNASANQPYYVAAHTSGTEALRNWAGGANTTFKFLVHAQVSSVRGYSNAGAYEADRRLAIQLTVSIELTSGAFEFFRLPPITWALFKL